MFICSVPDELTFDHSQITKWPFGILTKQRCSVWRWLELQRWERNVKQGDSGVRTLLWLHIPSSPRRWPYHHTIPSTFQNSIYHFVCFFHLSLPLLSSSGGSAVLKFKVNPPHNVYLIPPCLVQVIMASFYLFSLLAYASPFSTRTRPVFFPQLQTVILWLPFLWLFTIKLLESVIYTHYFNCSPVSHST